MERREKLENPVSAFANRGNALYSHLCPPCCNFRHALIRDWHKFPWASCENVDKEANAHQTRSVTRRIHALRARNIHAILFLGQTSSGQPRRSTQQQQQQHRDSFPPRLSLIETGQSRRENPRRLRFAATHVVPRLWSLIDSPMTLTESPTSIYTAQ